MSQLSFDLSSNLSGSQKKKGSVGRWFGNVSKAFVGTVAPSKVKHRGVLSLDGVRRYVELVHGEFRVHPTETPAQYDEKAVKNHIGKSPYPLPLPN